MPLQPDRLRAARQKIGFRQQDLVDRSLISLSQIQRYERGTADASGDHLASLAKALNCSVDYLVGLIEEPGGHYIGRVLTSLEEHWLLALHRQDRRSVVKIYHERGAELMYEELGKASEEDATIPISKTKKGLTTGER